MKILKYFKIIDKALLINDILIFSDVHIGYEEALNKQGILIPRLDFKDLIKNIDKILAKTKKLSTIVINGDLKHEFGTISDQEWRQTLKFFDHLAKKCKKIILVKGNHDTILGPIAKKRNIKVVDHYILKEPNNKSSINKISKIIKKKKNKNILIIHGDKIPDKKLLKNIDIIIIGHEHPAVSIKDFPRVEIYKCFLVGKWKNKNLIVLPSFITINEGHDITKEENLSPFLDKGFSKFRIYVVADKVYDFGKVKNL